MHSYKDIGKKIMHIERHSSETFFLITDCEIPCSFIKEFKFRMINYLIIHYNNRNITVH